MVVGGLHLCSPLKKIKKKETRSHSSVLRGMSGRRAGGHTECGLLFKLQMQGDRATARGRLGVEGNRFPVFLRDFNMFKCYLASSSKY